MGDLKAARYCVINCENSKAWDPINFGDMFQNCLQDTDRVCNCTEEWIHCNVALGDTLPNDLENYQGVVLTGSHFNVCDADNEDKGISKWFHELTAFIRKAAFDGTPRIFGGCFGTQVIAAGINLFYLTYLTHSPTLYFDCFSALGGNIDKNPKNRFVFKAESVRFCTSSDSLKKILGGNENDAIYQTMATDHGQPRKLSLISSHGYCVSKLPPGAILIATSDSCENELYVCGKAKNIMGCQSHPEFDYKYCIEDRILKAVTSRLSKEELNDAISSFASYTKDDAAVLLRIIRLFLQY